MKKLACLMLLAGTVGIIGCSGGVSEADARKNDQQIADANKKIDEGRTLPPGDGPLK